MQRTEQGYLNHLYDRELSAGARQYTVSGTILCEQCTEFYLVGVTGILPLFRSLLL